MLSGAFHRSEAAPIAAPPTPSAPPGPIAGRRVQLLAVAARAGFVAQSFLIGVVLTRLLEPDDVGRWFTILSASAIATAVLGQGLPFGAARALALDPASGRGVLAGVRRRTLGPWLVAVGAVAVLLAVDGGGDAWALALTVVLLTGPQLLERAYSEAGRGAHVDAVGILGDGVLSRSLFTAGAASLLLLGLAPSVALLAGLLAVCIAAFVVAAHVLVGRALPPIERPPAPSPFTAGLWAHAVTTAFLSQGDLFVGALLLDRDEVADYAIAWRVGGLVTLPLVALVSVVPGRIYAAVGRRDLDGLRATMAAPMRRAGAASMVLFAGLVAVGRPALTVAFGDAYTGAYVPMVVIACAQLVSMWSGPSGHVLIGAGRERDLVVATGTSAVMLAVLVPPGALLLGPTGVALAMAAAMVGAALIRNGLAQRTIGGRGVGTVWRFRATA